MEDFKVQKGSLENEQHQKEEAKNITLPDWVTKEDKERLLSDKSIILSLITTESKIVLMHLYEELFKDNDNIEIHFPIFLTDLNSNSNSPLITRKKLIVNGKKMDFTLLVTFNSPPLIKNILRKKLKDIEMENERKYQTIVKPIIRLKFNISKDDFVRYLLSKIVVLSAIELEI